LVVKNSGNLSPNKKAKTEVPGKEANACAGCWEAAATEKAGKSDGPYCKIHRMKGHDLQECHQVEQLVKKQRAEYEKRDKERDRENNGGKGRGNKEGHHGKTPPQNSRPNMGHEKKEEEEESDGGDGEDTSEHEFQRATEAMCIDGGASLHSSHRQLKQWA
jgi:hypothetical protein